MKEKMQNLVKLLNEYEKWKSEKYGRGNYVWGIDKDIGCIFASRFPDGEYICEDESRAIIICKGYNFIKRLVENDKIDESKIFCDQGLYYSLLCKLAISDTPIEDLVSYLK